MYQCFAGSRKISCGDSSVLFGLKMAKRPQPKLAIFGRGCGSRIAAAQSPQGDRRVGHEDNDLVFIPTDEADV